MSANSKDLGVVGDPVCKPVRNNLPDSRPDAGGPFPENGATDGVVAACVEQAKTNLYGAAASPSLEPLRCACGAESPAGSHRCLRCGTFLAGNQAARTSGVYAKQQPLEIMMTADQVLDGLVADKGGTSEMTTLERSAAAKVRDVEILLALNKQTIIRDRLASRSGQRAHDRYLAATDRWLRLVDKLGMGRRSKRVPTAAELLRGESDGGRDED
jgi:hypothetical protein